MTISHQPPQKPSPTDAPKSFRIPSRPSPTPGAGQAAPAWQKETLEDQKQETDQKEAAAVQDDEHTFISSPSSPATPQQADVAEVFTRPLPATTKDTPSPDAPLSVEATGSLPNSQKASDHPPLPPTVANRAARGRGKRGPLFIVLAILAALVVVGGLLGPHLLANNPNNVQGSTLPNFSASGPYAQVPLTASQINAIEHLAGHMKYKALASLYVSHMSLDDKIGQLIMVEYNQPTYSDDLDYMLNTLHVGGVIMYEFQMTSFDQTKNDIAKMQQRANIPLIISTDEEGGPYVRRLDNIYGYRMDATDIAATGDVNVATQQGLKVSQQMAALGLNEDLTPDVDVNQVNGYDMVTRTFGTTPDQVIKFAGPYMQAMQGNGTIACLKHYPGLGAAVTDAHTSLPVVNSSAQDIYNTDLAPFKAFIQSPNALLNPGMIMPTDVLMPAIDPKYPAELSSKFMTDILRKQFGYDGVVLTDALYMQGITNTWDMYTASVMALQAGDDMLLGANGTDQTIGVINAIKQALQDGQLTQARIDESVTRIIALKMQYHLMPTYVPGM
jgi:beta-N-acetylhexosaminidase